MAKKLKWALLASGTGSILKAMLERGLRPDVVLVDEDCPAADIADAASVPVVCMLREGKYNPKTRECDPARVAFTIKVVERLKELGIDVVVMAGCMTVFSDDMFKDDAFPGQVLNTHPALLPSFKGHKAVHDALAFGVKVTGCTIHIATRDVDHGPILAQVPVMVQPDDTEETLHEKIKVQERRLYGDVVEAVLDSDIVLEALWLQWLAKQS